ncbi:hypothetical protein GE061_013812 [Apolygus lucorum]|uniref:Uncharacterized protein n=1 Tax=Apolygus lucorum TaxID=248454 RepID=A0A8S9XSW9_APOLU|nr:hypothetical protein GE061_013812 [Apolygus lucorum]
MDLPEIVSSGGSKGANKKKPPVRIPWQIGGGGDTDNWKPARCRPTSLDQAIHKYEGLVRARDETRKTEIAKKLFRNRISRKPIITFPSEDNVVQRVESPFAIMESDLLESYYCRPPKVSPSLMELLDKYYEPINREFQPSYLNLPTIQTEPDVQLTETAHAVVKGRREKKERKILQAKKEEISNMIRTRIKGLKRLRVRAEKVTF